MGPPTAPALAPSSVCQTAWPSPAPSCTYVADSGNSAIRIVDTDTNKEVTTLAGSKGLGGIEEGIGTNAGFGFPVFLCRSTPPTPQYCTCRRRSCYQAYHSSHTRALQPQLAPTPAATPASSHTSSNPSSHTSSNHSSSHTSCNPSSNPSSHTSSVLVVVQTMSSRY